MRFIDTHAHLDGEEFATDRHDVMQRAQQAGCTAIMVPAIDLSSSARIIHL
ncbi:MAG: TatD family hydrolase, partial [Prevotella sp.]|nr:TatD family hydrolase [Prevotella sp.]